MIDAIDESGEGQRDLVVELGAGRLVEELERALTGASAGETKEVEFESAGRLDREGDGRRSRR